MVSTLLFHDRVFRVAGTVKVRDVCTGNVMSRAHAILKLGSRKLCKLGRVVAFGVFG